MMRIPSLARLRLPLWTLRLLMVCGLALLGNRAEATGGTNPVTPTGSTITSVTDTPTVAFAAPTTVPVLESTGQVTLTVQLSQASTNTVTVQYQTADGTATAPGDYTATNGTLVFAPGQTTQQISVALVNTNVGEEGVAATVVLSNPQNATLDTNNAVATFQIYDNNGSLPTIQFSQANYNVSESAGSVTITVQLSQAVSYPVIVSYATADGTATAGTDYQPASGTLTINPGDTSATFTITIYDDNLVEGDETINLSLSNAYGAALNGQSAATVTILDDDAPQPTVQFSSDSYTVCEGDGSATITVTLSNASTQTVTVNFATADGTAVYPTDYTATQGTLTFAPGVTSQTFQVVVVDNFNIEPSRTVLLALSSPQNATLGTPNTATLTITDDDTEPMVQFDYTKWDVGGSTTATISVSLSFASTSSVSVNYATADDTAFSPADYQGTTGTLVFAPGQLTNSFTVTVTPTWTDGSLRDAKLMLSNPQGASPGVMAACLVISATPSAEQGKDPPVKSVVIDPVSTGIRFRPDSAENSIKNPAGIVILGANDQTDKKVPIIFAKTVNPPKSAHRLVWTVVNMNDDGMKPANNQNPKWAEFISFNNNIPKGTGDKVFLYGVTEGRIKLEVRDKDAAPNSKPLEYYEAKVVKLKKLVYRVNRLRGADSSLVAADYAAGLVKIANIYYRQVGIVLVNDTSNFIPDKDKKKVTKVSGMPGFFEVNDVDNVLLKKVKTEPNAAGKTLEINFNSKVDKVIQITFVYSIFDVDKNIDVEGYTPFAPNNGLPLDKKGNGFFNLTYRLTDDPSSFGPQKLKFDVEVYKKNPKIFGVLISNLNGKPRENNPVLRELIERDYGFTLAHELGHLLTLLHRPMDDGISLPKEQNVMHRTIQGNWICEDFDLIQLYTMRLCPLLQD